MPAIENLQRYVPAKNYQNRHWFDKVIAKIKRCSFFNNNNSICIASCSPKIQRRYAVHVLTHMEERNSQLNDNLSMHVHKTMCISWNL